MTLVNWFNEIGRGDRARVGGKGASLGELTRAGLTVPDGFCVTVEAFERFIRAVDPDGTIRAGVERLDPKNNAAVAAATKAMRAQVLGAPLPQDLHDEIAGAYARLGGGDGAAPVAVRSSATSEDSDEASFAGLQDTYLWVMGTDAVITRIRECWASLYSDPSVLYRLRLDLPEKDVAMSVVVQKMVAARCAGVMFTRSPTTGDRSVIAINASWGLGSAIVSGEVTPDEYFISKVTGETLKKTVADKQMRDVPDPDRGGIRSEAVPDELRKTTCLSDGDLAALVEIAKRCEAHYGAPQDIEWAIAGEGADAAIYILQSRPETVWAGKRNDPVEKPKERPFDHVMGTLLGGRKV